MSLAAVEDWPSIRVDSSCMFSHEAAKRRSLAAGYHAKPPVGAGSHEGIKPTGSPATEAAVHAASPAELEWIAEQSRRLEGRSPEEILTWAVQRYFPRFTMATGLGPEGCVIISLLARIEPRVYIFNLDTGYQFPETLQLRQRINEKYGIDIDLQRPELSVTDYERLHNGPVYAHDADRCCHDRKIAVLHRVAVNYDAWATGIRRDQGPTRADTPVLKSDGKLGRVKLGVDFWGRDDKDVAHIYAPIKQHFEDVVPKEHWNKKYPSPLWDMGRHIDRVVRECLLSEYLAYEMADSQREKALKNWMSWRQASSSRIVCRELS